MKDPYTGSCLCGALCYEIKGEPITVYNCHCTECQKVAASAFGMSVRVGSEDFSITNGIYEKIKTIADNGSIKTGFFCPECGTRICGKSDNIKFVVVKAGTLGNPNWFFPIAHIWTRSAQDWFPFADGLPKFSEQPENNEELNKLWQKRSL